MEYQNSRFLFNTEERDINAASLESFLNSRLFKEIIQFCVDTPFKLPKLEPKDMKSLVKFEQKNRKTNNYTGISEKVLRKLNLSKEHTRFLLQVAQCFKLSNFLMQDIIGKKALIKKSEKLTFLAIENRLILYKTPTNPFYKYYNSMSAIVNYQMGLVSVNAYNTNAFKKNTYIKRVYDLMESSIWEEINYFISETSTWTRRQFLIKLFHDKQLIFNMLRLFSVSNKINSSTEQSGSGVLRKPKANSKAVTSRNSSSVEIKSQNQIHSLANKVYIEPVSKTSTVDNLQDSSACSSINVCTEYCKVSKHCSKENHVLSKIKFWEEKSMTAVEKQSTLSKKVAGLNELSKSTTLKTCFNYKSAPSKEEKKDSSFNNLETDNQEVSMNEQQNKADEKVVSSERNEKANGENVRINFVASTVSPRIAALQANFLNKDNDNSKTQ